MLKATRYRLYPTPAQEVILVKTFGCCRFVYNYLLAHRKSVYEQSGVRLSGYDLIKMLPELKKEFEWLREVSAVALQKSVFNMDSAYKNFFRTKKGFPKFKSKYEKQSCKFDLGVDSKDGKVKLPKLGWVKVRGNKEGIGTLKSITISKSVTGKYYASCLYDTGESAPEKQPYTNDTTVGVDLGLTTFATLSDGTKIPNPRFYLEVSQRIRHLQVIESKKRKGSNQRKRIRNKINKLYERKKNLTQNWLHHVINSLLDENQAVAVEDLNVKGMMANRKLANAISQVCWSEFKRILEYKAAWRGKSILTMDRFFPSSKTCSVCGTKVETLSLKVRTWTCTHCLTTHDRDVNAAINIKNFGLTLSTG